MNEKLYFAPLEGITGYVFRNAFHSAIHSKIDKYFSPFISPGVNQPLTPKELRDIHPDNNKGMYLVPQILANNPDDFLLAAEHIKELGYKEINLNLGCPSGTVVSKRKGSGMLGEPLIMERMLDKIYSTLDIKVSVKTRIGKDSPEEFPDLLRIFNKFPIEELIIHPRIRTDFYKNNVNMEMFDLAYRESKNPLCYNGDIVNKENAELIKSNYPNVKAIMIGRGFLHNPMLADEITENNQVDMKKLRDFHDILLEAYKEVMSGEKPVLFKMKELWGYMITLFDDADKYAKKIRKVEKLGLYNTIVDELFSRV